MKQVVFAIALLAMASLTGCLNTEDSPVDENIDTTDDSTSDTTEDNSDTTDDTKDDELIEPVTNSNITSPDLTEIEILLDSINDQLSELENIATALETSNQHIENSYYQPGEQSSVNLMGVLVHKNGNNITVDCSSGYDPYDSDLHLYFDFFTENQVLIASETNLPQYGAFSPCHEPPKDLELKREPVIVCMAYSHSMKEVIYNTHIEFTHYTCNTF